MMPEREAHAEGRPSGFPAAILVSRRSVLSDDVYEALKALIMDLQLVPGSRINMDALARQLNLSITPIREALARLESEELVAKLPMRGYIATPLLAAEELENMYEMRLQLEPRAAKRAAERITPEQLRSLTDEIDSSPPIAALRHYDDYRALMTHDARFHEAIHLAAGNQMVADALGRLHSHLHLFRLGYNRPKGEATADEHRAIYTAIAGGHAEDAFLAMQHHLENARDRLTSDPASEEHGIA